jgi:hypothetical protein
MDVKITIGLVVTLLAILSFAIYSYVSIDQSKEEIGQQCVEKFKSQTLPLVVITCAIIIISLIAIVILEANQIRENVQIAQDNDGFVGKIKNAMDNIPPEVKMNIISENLPVAIEYAKKSKIGKKLLKALK